MIDADPALAPTISGTKAGQATTSEAPVKPFSGVTVADPNAGATETLTIAVSGAGGALSGTGLTGGTGGVYTLSGTAATVTSQLDALSFTPTAGAPGTSSTTSFKLSDASSAFATPTVNRATSVINSDPATTPAQAWAAYQSSGIPTANLIVSNGVSITGSAKGSTTLYGAGYLVHLIGTTNETNFVGGLGTQYINGGAGANIVSYLTFADSTVQHPDIISTFDSAKDVIDLSRLDANPAVAGLQNFSFIGTAAFSSSGAQVRYRQDPTKNVTYVEATMAGNSTPDLYFQLSGLQTLTAANFALTASQSTADMANGAALGVATIRPSTGCGIEYSYTNVQGRSYSSYQAFYSNSLTHVANNLNLSASSNEMDLSGSGVTIVRSGSAEQVKVATSTGTSTFSVSFKANETSVCGPAPTRSSSAKGSATKRSTISTFPPRTPIRSSSRPRPFPISAPG